MFAEVAFSVADPGRAMPALGRLLAVLGAPAIAGGSRSPWGDFVVTGAGMSRPPTRAAHVAFRAPDEEAVRRFWSTGLELGFADDGPPGERPRYLRGYFGAFLRDGAGNSLEAVLYPGMRDRGVVDHVWLRVSDLDASRLLYDDLMRRAGGRRVASTGSLARYSLGPRRGSLTLVAASPEATTVSLDLKFATEEGGRVTAGHARPDATPGEAI